LISSNSKVSWIKIFNNGITSVQTADEHWMIMKIIISIIDSIFDDKDPRIVE
jgi:hypothetical protein